MDVINCSFQPFLIIVRNFPTTADPKFLVIEGYFISLLQALSTFGRTEKKQF